MKDVASKYAFPLLALVVVALACVFWYQGSVGTSATPSPTGQSQAGIVAPATSSPAKAQTQAQTQTKASAPVQTTAKTNPAPASTGTYADYQMSLQECNQLANAQYNQLYGGTLESSSFTADYSPTTGLCYMEVTGQASSAYSTTTTGYIYFRDVSGNALIAECINSTGIWNNGSQASCVDKVTGQTMNLSAFTGLMESYLK